MHYVTSGLAILIGLIILIFAFQNRESVSVAFLAWSISLPKIFLILGIYLLGALSGLGVLALAKKAWN